MPASASQTLDAIMTAESGGKNVMNYKYQTNPSLYTAGGYWQITNSTWREIAPQAGVDVSQYPTAISAPYDVQRAAAAELLAQRGTTPWNASASKWQPIVNGQASALAGPQDAGTGATGLTAGGTTSLGTLAEGGGEGDAIGSQGFNTYGSGYQNAGFQVNPYGGSETIYQQTPNSGGQTATGITSFGGNSAASSEGSAPGYLPPILTGGPFALGLTPGLSQAVGSWMGTLETGVNTMLTSAETAVGNAFKNAMSAVLGEVENLGIRALVILIALVLIAFALWKLLSSATGDGAAAGKVHIVPVPV